VHQVIDDFNLSQLRNHHFGEGLLSHLRPFYPFLFICERKKEMNLDLDLDFFSSPFMAVVLGVSSGLHFGLDVCFRSKLYI
jgi:hypothetical protein